ncbi:MAG TPA: DNA polymerase IV [Pseudobdellovibrionaceae bacterium]|nr:DNA polymerase IV [Pseudobdellovibrionaceae bacterium]
MRKIIHIDMDCFYAAVEVKYRPELKGKPLGIGGPPNSRSVLCTASYEARKFKVRSAMPSSQAVRLCPDLILIPPNFELYKKESRAIHEIFRRFTDLIEPLSLDEAFLDVTDCTLMNGSATLIAREIRRQIQEELRLPASAGIAPNKFLAKVASDWKKPNGQFTIRPEDIENFMKTLPVERIYGVGKVTAAKMHEKGIRTCEDLQKKPFSELRLFFGSRASELLDLAHGVDSRPVRTHRQRKSLTVEETYSRDLRTLSECLEHLPELFHNWEKRMLKSDLADRIRGLVVKLRYHDFKSSTHECVFEGWPTVEHFETLLQTAWERRADPVRLLGVGVRLAAGESDPEGPQMDFFSGSSAS